MVTFAFPATHGAARRCPAPDGELEAGRCRAPQLQEGADELAPGGPVFDGREVVRQALEAGCHGVHMDHRRDRRLLRTGDEPTARSPGAEPGTPGRGARVAADDLEPRQHDPITGAATREPAPLRAAALPHDQVVRAVGRGSGDEHGAAGDDLAAATVVAEAGADDDALAAPPDTDGEAERDAGGRGPRARGAARRTSSASAASRSRARSSVALGETDSVSGLTPPPRRRERPTRRARPGPRRRCRSRRRLAVASVSSCTESTPGTPSTSASSSAR